MKTTIKNIYAVFLLVGCALPALTSCSDDIHEGEIGVNVALMWQDEEDAGTPISDVRLWMYTTDGTEIGDYHYTDAREVAKLLWPLAVGEYRFVATANFVEPFVATTAASGSQLFSLSDASASPTHAYYSVEETVVSALGVQRVRMPLKRILSELTVIITGAPDGMVFTGTVDNATIGIYPMEKKADGSFGTTAGQSMTVNIPETTAQSGTIRTETLRLMPTVNGASQTTLSFQLRNSAGSTNHFTLSAPLTNIGGKYCIELNYDEMTPFIYLSPITIDNWTESWVVNGEILNPEEGES